jgi:hypothetical protein
MISCSILLNSEYNPEIQNDTTYLPTFAFLKCLVIDDLVLDQASTKTNL